eukprot:g21706.t1
MSGRESEQLLLSKLCDRGAALQPQSLVITKIQQGYHTRSYADQLRRAKRLASALQRWGDRVATLMWNSGWHFECYQAIRLGQADLGYIIHHAQDRIIFVDANLIQLLEQISPSDLATVELFVCAGSDGEANQWKSSQLDSRKTIDYEAFLNSGHEDGTTDGPPWRTAR